MIAAVSVKTKVLITLWGEGLFRLERRKQGEDWLILNTDGQFYSKPEVINFLTSGDFVDSHVTEGLYQYRCIGVDENQQEVGGYFYSLWVICGNVGPVGYTFNNYTRPEGHWGDIICPDDLRFTYLWGTDLKAANGQSYDDEQIRFFIKAAEKEISRQLDITIEKQRIVCKAREKGLKKKIDYDVDEDYYRFDWSKISRYGKITTRLRPILRLNRIVLKNRFTTEKDLTSVTEVDRQKGVLLLLERPYKPSATNRGIASAIGMYGTETIVPYLFYEVDYEAGYETSDDVPFDLREIVAKLAAVSMLNVVGDGLMSGFSSSSLSMDGMSESFSSTQSATSAYFGARIKEYKDDIDRYIKANKRKFTNIPMGCL